MSFKDLCMPRQNFSLTSAWQTHPVFKAEAVKVKSFWPPCQDRLENEGDVWELEKTCRKFSWEYSDMLLEQIFFLIGSRRVRDKDSRSAEKKKQYLICLPHFHCPVKPLLSHTLRSRLYFCKMLPHVFLVHHLWLFRFVLSSQMILLCATVLQVS